MTPPLEDLEDVIISLKLNRLLRPLLLPILLKPRSPYEMPLPGTSGLIRPESMASSIDLHASVNGVSTFSPVREEHSRYSASIQSSSSQLSQLSCPSDIDH